LVDHSILFLLLNPKGQYVAFYDNHADVDTIMADIAYKVKAYEKA